jgi:hypothetical protein
MARSVCIGELTRQRVVGTIRRGYAAAAAWRKPGGAMEGFLASVVLIAILLGFLFAVGGLVYLLARRLSKRSPKPVILPGREPWFGPAGGAFSYSPASSEGHAVGVVAIAAAIYLVQAGQVLASVVVVVTMVIIVFLKGAPPGAGRESQESHGGEHR